MFDDPPFDVGSRCRLSGNVGTLGSAAAVGRFVWETSMKRMRECATLLGGWLARITSSRGVDHAVQVRGAT